MSKTGKGGGWTLTSNDYHSQRPAGSLGLMLLTLGKEG